MALDRWHEIKSLFVQIRDLESNERSAFLDKACANDPALRKSLEELLESAEHPANFFEPSSERPELFNASLRPFPNLAPGIVVAGRYRIEERLSGGGLGEVYRARDERLPDRIVILKFRSFHEQMPEGFRREIEALARIEHSSVVGVLDVGETDSGERFIVTKYVPGISLREALREAPFGVKRGCSLMRQLSLAL